MNDYLSKQIITYIGNKRGLLNEIDSVVSDIENELSIEKNINDIVAMDLFSGSGIVSRLFKEHNFKIIANDLEKYSCIINECYLSNWNNFDEIKYNEYYEKLDYELNHSLIKGIISKNYAPENGDDIKIGERVFYTPENAKIIDTIRKFIDENVEEDYRKYFLAPLLYEASVHTNTSGVFKGFYKNSKTKIGQYGGDGENALQRIKGTIKLDKPIFSKNENEYWIYNEDANILVNKIHDVDIAYLDPPYNQHPYGSNYFMLNIIADNKIPDQISKISGIPNNWNHSNYNKKSQAKLSIENLIQNLDSKYIIISYNSEGFITFDEMKDILSNYGELKIKEIKYNTFRGSRNLKDRDLYVSEYIFILKKDKKNI